MNKTKNEKNKNNSVGVVETQYYTFAEAGREHKMESGDTLGPITLAYETYGKLNKDKSNAILALHALSGDAHAAGIHSGQDDTGWWDNMIGPGGLRYKPVLRRLLKRHRRLQRFYGPVFPESGYGETLRSGFPLYHCGRYGSCPEASHRFFRYRQTVVRCWRFHGGYASPPVGGLLP
jgi:hypothetical protein